MATNPPITIGIFSNVPQPGAGVKSAWAQDVSRFVSPTPWTPVAFTAPWVDFGGGAQTCQYRKVGDIVYLRGAMKNGTLNTTAFTLPAGFRPPVTIGMPVGSASLYGQVTVDASGAVSVVVGPAGAISIVLLNSIFFSTVA